MEATPQDLSKQTEAVLKELQTDIATVMGPALAGSLDPQQLQDRLLEVGYPPARASSAEDKAAYMKKLSDIMQKAIQEQTTQAFNAAQGKAGASNTFGISLPSWDRGNGTSTPPSSMNISLPY